jgi:predicted RNA-binding Zn ribbon-like protein
VPTSSPPSRSITARTFDGEVWPHGSPGAIPHTLSEHLCVDFVNSRFSDHTGSGRIYDRLDLQDWQHWFAARCGLTIEQRPSAAIHRDLIDLRRLLRRLLESRSEPTDRDLAKLSRILASSSQFSRLERVGKGFTLRRLWRDEDWRAVMAATVASYGRLLVGGQMSRIRVCSNPDCTFVFYDTSRNGTRRWCDGRACGNLVKVRRHRDQRQRQ